MSEEERVYTINLAKIVLTPMNKRSNRAINMIKAYASKHMKSNDIKIDQELNELIWAKGIRSPPRRIRVKISKDADDVVIIKPYTEEVKEDKDTEIKS
jgi:large subunit ribosomal protein L31e